MRYKQTWPAIQIVYKGYIIESDTLYGLSLLQPCGRWCCSTSKTAFYLLDIIDIITAP